MYGELSSGEWYLRIVCVSEEKETTDEGGDGEIGGRGGGGGATVVKDAVAKGKRNTLMLSRW